MGPRLLSRGVSRGELTKSLLAAGASMGPRLLSRGVLPGLHVRLELAQLQWGRGFSAAESRQPEPAGDLGDFASMGPRLLSRGVARNQRTTCRPTGGFNGAAASQPRSPADARNSPSACRGFNGAAASQPRSRLSLGHRAVSISSASMGPRLLSRGVISSQHLRPCAASGFNGAAASQPRSPRTVSAFSPALKALQWGRGFSAAESALAIARPVSGGQASMGPRLLSRGVRRPSTPSWARCSCFNGAAASQPRSRAQTAADRN